MRCKVKMLYLGPWTFCVMLKVVEHSNETHNSIFCQSKISQFILCNCWTHWRLIRAPPFSSWDTYNYVNPKKLNECVASLKP